MSRGVFKKLPPEALALGTPLAFYRNWHKNAPTFSNQFSFGCGLFLLFFLLVWGIFFLVTALTEAPWRENKADGWGFLLPLTFGSVMLFAFACGVIRLIRVTLIPPRFRGVYTFTNGLVLSHRDRVSVVPFDKIVAVWDEGSRFQTLDNDLIEWPHTLEKSHILAELVLRETLRPIAERHKAALESGAAVAFGPLLISREGIAFDGQRLEWHEILYVFRDKEQLIFLRYGDVIHRKAGSLQVVSRERVLPAPSVPLSEVPNLHLLWPLLEQLRPGVLESSDPSSAQQSSTTAQAANSGASQQQSSTASTPAPLAVYEMETAQYVDVVLRLFGNLIGGLAFAGLGLYFQREDRSWYFLFWLGLFLIGAALTSISLVGFWVCLRKITTRVSLYPNGFDYARVRSHVFCRWEEIREGRWRRRGTFPAPALGPNYEIITTAGKRFLLEKGLQHQIAVVIYIQEVLVPYQLPAVLEQFYAGETILFPYGDAKAVGVSLDGVRGDAWDLDWDEISGAAWKDWEFQIHRHGSRRAAGDAPYDEMLNPHLIVPLIQEVLRRRHWV